MPSPSQLTTPLEGRRVPLASDVAGAPDGAARSAERTPRKRRPSSSTLQLEKVIRVSASTILIVFAGVALYSFWLGGIDLVIPLKYALLTVIFIPVYKTLDDAGLMSRDDRRASPKTLGIHIHLFILEVLGAALLLRYSIPFLLSSFSNVDLMTVGVDVKLPATFAVVPSIIIASLDIGDILKLKLPSRLGRRGA